MKQSPLPSAGPLHVALIMDGNGRWAAARGMPRSAGHRAGAKVARRIVEAAPRAGIGTLTLYAFSADNWRRPPREVAALMRLFRAYLIEETQRCVANGVRLTIVGRRDRLSASLRAAIEAAESTTAEGRTLHLRVALDYSAREAIVRAAEAVSARSGGAPLSRAAFGRLLGEADHSGAPAPDVDLLIRTGGEQRLSDFLLWECAYAELHFSPRLWPDYTAHDLCDAVADFHGRERRFGGVPAAAAV